MHISGIIKTIKVIVTERKGYTDRKGREYKRKRRVRACILPPSSFVTKGGFFTEKIEGNNQNRLAVLAVMVEDIQSAGKVNALLSEYGEYIVGRMGLPYKEKDLSVISVVLDAPAEKINALTGKIGVIDGVSAKTLFSRF